MRRDPKTITNIGSSGVLIICGDEVLLFKASLSPERDGTWTIPFQQNKVLVADSKTAKEGFTKCAGIKLGGHLKVLLLGDYYVDGGYDTVYLVPVRNKIDRHINLGVGYSAYGWFRLSTLPKNVSTHVHAFVRDALNRMKNQ